MPGAQVLPPGASAACPAGLARTNRCSSSRTTTSSSCWMRSRASSCARSWSAAPARLSVAANNQLHARLASTDYGTFAVVRDGDRLYFTVENRVQQGGNTHPFRNRLACYDLVERQDPLGYRQQPRQRGEALLPDATGPLPQSALRAGPQGAGVLHSQSGCCHGRKCSRPSTSTPGGTTLVRVLGAAPDRRRRSAPARDQCGRGGRVPAARSRDAPGLRRYETRTPHQPAAKARKITMRGFGYRVQTVQLEKWKPLRPIVHRGRIIVAPIDSDALVCLSAQTGKVEWMLPRSESAAIAALRSTSSLARSATTCSSLVRTCSASTP